VEKGTIRRLADALGDPNPLYTDEEAARAAGHAGLLAPPIFPAVLAVNDRFRHSLDLGTRSLLLSEQQFEYGRPIVAGDRIIIRNRVADVQEKSGPSGPMDVIVIEAEGRSPEGEIFFRSRETLVLRRG
jgi:acyl dehydratase